ncbi:MAG: hypothetical protein WBF64_06725 [Xanthobacteraceae bacterium]
MTPLGLQDVSFHKLAMFYPAWRTSRIIAPGEQNAASQPIAAICDCQVTRPVLSVTKLQSNAAFHRLVRAAEICQL